MTPLISICIPTYEMNGMGAQFLEQTFRTILAQIFTDYEVIVSDHSQNDAILDLCTQWQDKFSLTYLKNTQDRGKSAANVNNAIRHAKGYYIKPLFQDDIFYTSTALLEFYSLAEKTNTWVASGCWHFDETSKRIFAQHTPRWHYKMVYGVNTLGAPSVMMFKNDNNFFDDSLIWLMDCEFYYQLEKRYSKPALIKTPQLLVRQWPYSVTEHIATDDIRKNELLFVKKKTKETEPSLWLHALKSIIQKK